MPPRLPALACSLAHSLTHSHHSLFPGRASQDADVIARADGGEVDGDLPRAGDADAIVALDTTGGRVQVSSRFRGQEVARFERLRAGDDGDDVGIEADFPRDVAVDRVVEDIVAGHSAGRL